jgi:hypothetical protein
MYVVKRNLRATSKCWDVGCDFPAEDGSGNRKFSVRKSFFLKRDAVKCSAELNSRRYTAIRE